MTKNAVETKNDSPISSKNEDTTNERDGKANNASLLSDFVEALHRDDTIKATTRKDYIHKLNKLQKEVAFDASEEDIIEFLSSIENPNTRTNKGYVLQKLREFHQLPSKKIYDFRNDIKSEIHHHRKTVAKDNMESLCSYDELCEELDKMSGIQYLMNYFFVKHGLRNKDINMNCFHKKPKNMTGNYMVCNPKAKKPLVKLVINDYKTSKIYGQKTFQIRDKRFVEELNKLQLKHGQPLVTTRDGSKASDAYLGVLCARNSIRRYGEGKIAKILVKHCIDTKQFDKVQELSEQRGTSMGQLYTSYNILDSI